MSSKIDYSSPTTQFTFDINNSTFFKKDPANFINVLGVNQLNTLKNVSLLDIFLSVNNVVEPHYHQNSSELIYCISGAITVSILNPFTKELKHYPMTSGQATNVPRGWWHYIVATADDTHFLGIFDEPTPEVILGSDLLKLTPANIMAHTYCMDLTQWENAIAPVQPATIIGPPADCHPPNEQTSSQTPHYINQYNEQMAPYTYQNFPFPYIQE